MLECTSSRGIGRFLLAEGIGETDPKFEIPGRSRALNRNPALGEHGEGDAPESLTLPTQGRDRLSFHDVPSLLREGKEKAGEIPRFTRNDGEGINPPQSRRQSRDFPLPFKGRGLTEREGRVSLRGKGATGRREEELTPDTSVSPPLLKIEGEEREGPRYTLLPRRWPRR